MQCPELFASEAYFMLIAVAVGALVNVIKRARFMTSDAVPVLAFFVGWLFDAGLAFFACGFSLASAAVGGLGGGFAGLSAAGGHEALKRVTSRLGPPVSAFFDKVLGHARKEREERPKKKSTAAMIVFVALSVVACDGLLGTAARVVQVAGSAIEILEGLKSKSRAYFDRHPSLDNSQAVLDLIAEIRSLVESGEHDKAVALYAELRELLFDLGIPEAEPPAGGAETEAPAPEAFEVPTVDEFKAAL